eukprot:1159542-Pelagomonas_calceolata.AAC.15
MRKQGPHWNALLTEVRILECPKMHVEDHAHIEDTSLSKSYYFCMWADMGGMGDRPNMHCHALQSLSLPLISSQLAIARQRMSPNCSCTDFIQGSAKPVSAIISIKHKTCTACVRCASLKIPVAVDL